MARTIWFRITWGADGYLYIEGKGKVLVVTDPTGAEDEYRALVKALRNAEREVEVIPAVNVPRDALSLLPYDCIILVQCRTVLARRGTDAGDARRRL